MRRFWTSNKENATSSLRLEKRPNGMEVPTGWSALACHILSDKYAHKISETQWEDSAIQICARLAKAWSFWGWELGYFDDDQSRVFEDEINFALLNQMAAPNSPQWFNTGLFLAYGIEGDPLGHWYVDQDGQLIESPNAYERPQAHACFIQSVKSDLVRPGGLMDLWAKEARLFKLGSGTGTNFSVIPAAGEELPGGGVASGLMGFLKVGDASAGAIRSGGVTRRAAKMVILDIDHPDIIAFIDWKLAEERKLAALIEGSRIIAAKKNSLSTIPVTQFDGDFNGEGYASISGQNSNNSVRIPNKFFKALSKNGSWPLVSRVSGNVLSELDANTLWQRLCAAAWECADPGIQYSDTINYFHTCKSDGEIIASNPCSEYLFLENTGCNLASINLMSHYNSENNEFDLVGFVYSCRLWTKVLDISVGMAQYPSKEIAERSLSYRTLGLGYANLGALLMAMGISYDSDEGRNLAASLTSLMSASAYEESVALAQNLGSFPAYKSNKKSLLKVLETHAKLSNGESVGFDDIKFFAIDKKHLNESGLAIHQAANRTWQRVLEGAKIHGVRNAQVSVIAPTGTIGLLMDCDTTGIEPDYALVKNKKMVGGETKTIVNKAFELGLMQLGYERAQIDSIKAQVMKSGEITNALELKREHYKVFQTSLGENALSPTAHLEMVAACTPYVSGGISKTINLPHSATVEEVSELYQLAHKKGVKSISLYRDGCKLSQPLSAVSGKLLACPKCGVEALVPAGTCHKCENCGESTSCS